MTALPSALVNEWGCPSCGGLFVVTDQQAATHYRLCVPEEDEPCTAFDSDCIPFGDCTNCGLSRGMHPAPAAYRSSTEEPSD